MMRMKEAVVFRFQKICDQRNLTRNGLAALAGVTPSTVYSMMDENRKELSISTIKKLCDGLDLTIQEFFDDDIFVGLEQEIY